MYEPVNTSLVDDDDDEITSEIPYDPLSISMDGTVDSLDRDDQQSVSYLYLLLFIYFFSGFTH